MGDGQGASSGGLPTCASAVVTAADSSAAASAVLPNLEATLFLFMELLPEWPDFSLGGVSKSNRNLTVARSWLVAAAISPAGEGRVARLIGARAADPAAAPVWSRAPCGLAQGRRAARRRRAGPRGAALQSEASAALKVGLGRITAASLAGSGW